MNKPIIAVDIDDVLAQSVKALLHFTEERYGLKLSHDDYDEDLSKTWQVTPEEVSVRWLEYIAGEPMRHYEVIEEAKDVLVRLKERYSLIAVTSRRATYLPITNEWLNANYPGVMDEVISARIFGEGKENAHVLTKAEVLQDISAGYLIDDQFKHCNGAAEVGVKSLLFGGYPWNSHQELPEAITRVRNWQDVWEYFDRA